ncbi:membrane-associated tyrosine- and threonine-specific cdc2-inhibitory kinase [Electrophorus electricus]|uniref:non-specific serine/threonine protein kinase n=1 Tax=Electrophorus electricus TaxID=8005 RepID=A0A4W4HD13_ELEEL|nr:membrane-associated tyrosine- and threonine-specific cdc2-inhibitory kinase [Electrophorus electricus]XP_026864967.2 membrane-associated tyrosine- and threonine-specific cdc2-inhibitory kinase [Electrophorus electricus]
MSVVQETRTVSTPRPLPAHFSHAEQSFSLKKRRLAFSSSTSSQSASPSRLLSQSLPPRPPSKGCPPVSRVFPPRRAPWIPLSRRLLQNPPPCSLYDPGRPQSFFNQCFVNLGLIGRGSFGEVYKVRSLLDGQLYAVKRSAQRFRGEAERGRSIREARNHEGLWPHPHVLGFTAAWEEGDRLYIQTELCYTSLLLHSETQPSGTGEPYAWDSLCDLLSALKHLHSQGFAHLDLKPANVFLTRSGRLKLGDFGLLFQLPGSGRVGGADDDRGVEQDRIEKDEAQEGDPRYMAPELLRGEYGAAADIFSLGVSILELACNMEVPKGGEGWQQLRQGYLPSEFTNDLSPELQCVLRLMLAPDPRDRATAEQLLALPSVRNHRWRRRLSLQRRESWLSVLTFVQCVLAAVWSFLWSLKLRFLPRYPPPTPCTPPRESWEREGDVSALQHSAELSEEDSPMEAQSLEHSPTFSHRIQASLSVGSTSTPLPNSSALTNASPTQPTHSHHDSTHPCILSQSCTSLCYTQPGCTPSSSPSHSLSLSPIRCSSSTGSRHSTHSLDLRNLSDSPASSRCSRAARSWVETESEPVPRSGFEPKNLLSLFDETTTESEP